MSCGLEMAGHKCLLGVDFDKHAIATFQHNHPHASSYLGDIRELKGKTLSDLLKGQDVHLVVGGPPCQGFSTVGKGDPNDDRNRLFMEYFRIVKTLKPQFVVIENVTGLLAQKNEKTLQAIFKLFSQIGYHMDVRVMEAQHYGVPEKRKRSIIIGSNKKGKIIFPNFVTDTELNGKFIPAQTVKQALNDLRDANGKIHNHDLKTAQAKSKIDRDRLNCIPEGQGIRYQKDEEAFLPKRLHLGVDWKEMRENRFRQTKYQRLHWQKPSPTIMTHRYMYYHPTEPRFLTAREAAALQSFPNDFVFQGPVSAQWRQIGNAVPPLLAKALGMALSQMAKEANGKSKVLEQEEHQSIFENLRKTAFKYA